MAQYLTERHSEHRSHRGFLTINGTYRDEPVSIVAIGMGYPMMDMFVREARAITQGPLIIVRYLAGFILEFISQDSDHVALWMQRRPRDRCLSRQKARFW
jgi:hypothetical protein